MIPIPMVAPIIAPLEWCLDEVLEKDPETVTLAGGPVAGGVPFEDVFSPDGGIVGRGICSVEAGGALTGGAVSPGPVVGEG